MKNIFIGTWSEQVPNVILDLSYKLSMDRGDKLHIYLITTEQLDEVCLSEQINENHLNVSFELYTCYVGSQFSISEKLQKVQSLIKSIGDGVRQIYLRFHEGAILIEQMVAHECVQMYPDKVVFLVDSKSQNQCLVGEVMHERGLYHHVYELVSSANFSAAKKLLADHADHSLIVQLLELGNKLRTLDMDKHESDSLFSQLKQALSLLRSEKSCEEEEFIDSFKSLPKQEQKVFISFLFNYAELLYEEHDLIDFVVLYYRLAEEVLLYALGWDVGSANTFVLRKDAKYKLKIPKNERVTRHFRSYMKVLRQEIYHIEQRHHVRIKFDQCIGLERLPPRDRYFVELYLFFKNESMEKFLALRHEGVSGHGFADFTKEKFEAMFKGNAPLEKMGELLDKLSLRPTYSIFKLIQRAVLGLVVEKEQARLVK